MALKDIILIVTFYNYHLQKKIFLRIAYSFKIFLSVFRIFYLNKILEVNSIFIQAKKRYLEVSFRS